MFQTTQRVSAKRSVRLTRREMEVLELVMQGMRTKEAAEYLKLSKRTLDYHIFNIYAKLGAHNRVQAYNAARRYGLIPSEPQPRA